MQSTQGYGAQPSKGYTGQRELTNCSVHALTPWHSGEGGDVSLGHVISWLGSRLY